MEYDKIIVELLSRIQTLEEKVALLIAEKETMQSKESKRITTNDIREYIKALKSKEKKSGKHTLVLTARDIHRELNLKNRFPMVCNAMRDCMEDGDVVLFQPPKGNSSTLEIEYNL